MVNTFIPYSDFKKCARVLDNKRLGKQRVEAKQILNILTGMTHKTGWINHPVVKMWDGHTKALMLYYNTIVEEWIRRGFVNNMKLYGIRGHIAIPWFIGNKSVHMSHQANLIRKNNSYLKVFKNVPEDYIKHTYIWPSKLSKEQKEFLIVNKNKVVDIKQFSTLVKHE